MSFLWEMFLQYFDINSILIFVHCFDFVLLMAYITISEVYLAAINHIDENTNNESE